MFVGRKKTRARTIWHQLAGFVLSTGLGMGTWARVHGLAIWHYDVIARRVLSRCFGVGKV